MQKKIVKTCLNWEILLPCIIEAFYTWFQCLVLVDVILRLMFCNSKTQMENVERHWATRWLPIQRPYTFLKEITVSHEKWKAWHLSLQNETDSNHCNPNQQHSSVAWNGILSLWVKFEHNFVFPKHSSCQIYAIYLCYTSNKPWRWSRKNIDALLLHQRRITCDVEFSLLLVW